MRKCVFPGRTIRLNYHHYLASVYNTLEVSLYVAVSAFSPLRLQYRLVQCCTDRLKLRIYLNTIWVSGVFFELDNRLLLSGKTGLVTCNAFKATCSLT